MTDREKKQILKIIMMFKEYDEQIAREQGASYE